MKLKPVVNNGMVCTGCKNVAGPCYASGMKLWHLALVFCVLFWPGIVLAQFNINGFSNSVSLDVQPLFPEPNTTVTARINDFALSGGSGVVTWFVNGGVAPSFANRREILVPVGGLGEPTTITAQLEMVDGSVVTAKKTLVPSMVVVVLEPQTSRPTWYQGRPLPSVGSTVRAVAFPDVGDEKTPAEYTYTWEFADKVLNRGAVAGGNAVTFTMPFGRGEVLSVTVNDATGKTVAQRNVFVSNFEPEVYFYDVNLLRGQNQRALSPTFPLLGEEKTVRAEVFHIDKNLKPRNTLYEWKVNGQTITNPNQDQTIITLRNDGGSGRFNVSFHVRNLDQLLQGARGRFQIIF